MSLHAGGSGLHSLWLSAVFDPLVELSVDIMSVQSRLKNDEYMYILKLSQRVR